MANGDLLEAERLALERFESDEELQFTIAAPLIRAAIDIFMRAMRRGEEPLTSKVFYWTTCGSG